MWTRHAREGSLRLRPRGQTTVSRARGSLLCDARQGQHPLTARAQNETQRRHDLRGATVAGLAKEVDRASHWRGACNRRSEW